MGQIEAVIFDWAGTTVDYGCMAPIYAMQDAFSHANLSITLDEIRKPMGMLKIDHIKTVLDMDRVKNHFHEIFKRYPEISDIQSIYEQFEKNIFANLDQYTTLIAGILSVQDYCRKKNIKIGSTTGYTKDMVKIVADSAKQQGYLPDYIVASDQVKQGRPYPYMLFENLVALDVKDMRKVLKVGDTIVDIEEGLYAGCWTIGVIKGGSMMGLSEDETNALSATELNQRIKKIRYQMLIAGADYVIDSIGDLPFIIDLINHKLNYEQNTMNKQEAICC